ncbi:hypothetical protein A7K93_05185 [Candidatus Methylacidiphilum fumarolicum]|uniref:Uncharacterized protein n=2 Tax=Candidatus Methylacidiphilum fumarolicum TaxID=591154 RepID=I0JWI3_METFB|nr:hypothetical protein A7K73_07445 [Candidatus Methylacidiphilum fumarolicum]CCG91602.1 hypothetical protein MFUM_170015 [Methylacidiphilum fumariolicum SolV]TFE72566.1 hypothetical protein A7K72_08310 [Candidatus Methylacidiphilum fumarolicum]TFE73883.1 hypothetical protein A7K93_05185 [Candidatus Methylacidiphilum fumarolicum]TFE77503.1 hypothetical protein A7D33_04420 [Candidatus Methylacidiphilum fumarolicum]
MFIYEVDFGSTREAQLLKPFEAKSDPLVLVAITTWEEISPCSPSSIKGKESLFFCSLVGSFQSP